MTAASPTHLAEEMASASAVDTRLHDKLFPKQHSNRSNESTSVTETSQSENDHDHGSDESDRRRSSGSSRRSKKSTSEKDAAAPEMTPIQKRRTTKVKRRGSVGNLVDPTEATPTPSASTMKVRRRGSVGNLVDPTEITTNTTPSALDAMTKSPSTRSRKPRLSSAQDPFKSPMKSPRRIHRSNTAATTTGGSRTPTSKPKGGEAPLRRVKSNVTKGVSLRDDDDDDDEGEDLPLDYFYKNVFEISMNSMSHMSMADDSQKEQPKAAEDVTKSPSRRKTKEGSKRSSRSIVPLEDIGEGKEPSKRSSRTIPVGEAKEPSKRSSRTISTGEEGKEPSKRSSRTIPMGEAKESSKRSSRTVPNVPSKLDDSSKDDQDSQQLYHLYNNVFEISVGDIQEEETKNETEVTTPKKTRTMRRSSIGATSMATGSTTPIPHLSKEARTAARARVRSASIMIKQQQKVQEEQQKQQEEEEARIQQQLEEQKKLQQQQQPPKKTKRRGLTRRNSFGSTRDLVKPSSTPSSSQQDPSNNNNNKHECPSSTGMLRQLRTPRGARRQSMARTGGEIAQALVHMDKCEGGKKTAAYERRLHKNEEKQHLYEKAPKTPTAARPSLQRRNSFGSTRDVLSKQNNTMDDASVYSTEVPHSTGHARRLRDPNSRGGSHNRVSSLGRKEALFGALGNISENDDEKTLRGSSSSKASKLMEIQTQFQHANKEISKERSHRRERLSHVTPPEDGLEGFQLEKLVAVVKDGSS